MVWASVRLRDSEGSGLLRSCPRFRCRVRQGEGFKLWVGFSVWRCHWHPSKIAANAVGSTTLRVLGPCRHSPKP